MLIKTRKKFVLGRGYEGSLRQTNGKTDLSKTSYADGLKCLKL